MVVLEVVQGAAQAILLNGADIQALLEPASCVDAVEAAFRMYGGGRVGGGGVLGIPVAGGGFHVKAAWLPSGGSGAYFAAKLNANFPDNPVTRGLPTIQGLLLLCDAASGAVLAVMDSAVLTALRTAAATGVAVRHLARRNARSLLLAGCGVQAWYQLAAVHAERPLACAHVFDIRPHVARAFAARASDALGINVQSVPALRPASLASDVIVTCTPATGAFLGEADVSPGALVAAVGADNASKQELEPALLGAVAIITDVTAQCAEIGDLHHALVAGTVALADVRAELGEVVAGMRPGRVREDERIVFDSTGTALQDVAVAALAYERALATDAGRRFAFRV